MSETQSDSPLWRPSAERVANAQLTHFAAPLGFSPPDYAALHRWSVAHRAEFWRAVWEFCGVVGEMGDAVLVDGGRFPGSRWFPEARLNFAENLLRFADDRVAVVSVLEGGERCALTYRELRAQTMAFRQALLGKV